LPEEELIEYLRGLRTRAGDPSVRDLAKFTERQGPGRGMSRSTIQDKISGKSPLRLGQVLALVQACADYANFTGVTLAPEDTDQRIWNDRFHAISARTPPPSPAPPEAPANPSARWSLEPLALAGMHDMVDLVQANEHEPMASWLPTLIQELGSAGMSNEQFLRAASRESPPQVVASILALAASHATKAVERLIFLGSVSQPADHIPAIVALLRRRGGPEVGAGLADMLIDSLTRPRPWHDKLSDIGRRRYVAIVTALRGATMEKDAIRVLEGIGAREHANLILEVAASFPDRIYGDRETVLGSVAKGSEYHLKSVFSELRKTAIEGINPENTLDRIIFGIPMGQNRGIASFLKAEGMNEEAQRVLDLEDEPPF
jgi:hypothetical protein